MVIEHHDTLALTHLWAIRNLVENPKFDAVDIAHRKYFSNVAMAIPGEVWDRGYSITYDDLFYKEAKASQLDRNYYNAAALDRLVERLSDRVNKGRAAITTLAAQIGNQPKDEDRSLGFCMQSVVATHYRKFHGAKQQGLELTFHYRVTEVIKKFGADLIFLTERIVPHIRKACPDVPLKNVYFHWPAVYTSLLFIPVVFRMFDQVYSPADGIGWLQTLRHRDFPAWKYICQFIHRALTRPADSWSYAARKRAVRDLNLVFKGWPKERQEFLLKYLQTLAEEWKGASDK